MGFRGMGKGARLAAFAVAATGLALTASTAQADRGSSIDSARGLAVSPDGKSLYVISSDDFGMSGPNTLTNFSIGSNGLLTYVDCLSNSGGSGCTDIPGASFNVPSDIVVSPDGK